MSKERIECYKSSISEDLEGKERGRMKRGEEGGGAEGERAEKGILVAKFEMKNRSYMKG